MRKIVLVFLVGVLMASCDKTQKQPVNYSVTNDAQATGLFDVYIPDSGTYTMPLLVKFLSGYPEDSIKLVYTGLPNGITVTPDTFSAVPTYSTEFVFHTHNMAHGTYPVSLTAYTPTQFAKTYNFNVTVVASDAASIFWGPLNDSNTCTARTYKHAAIGAQSPYKNILVINNFGGYGPTVNLNVIFDQQHNTLSIPEQACGNGSMVSGSGTYTDSKMIITYSATSTPTNPAETCTSIFTR